MERISVFDIFKIGIGPSSSHTMGPWRAAQRFLREIDLEKTVAVQVELYGSLAKTGKGHGTDLAVLLGLAGHDPVFVAVEQVTPIFQKIKNEGKIRLAGRFEIPFDFQADLIFNASTFLPYHSNGLIFRAFYENGDGASQTYFSVGGGFVVKEGEENPAAAIELPYPIDKGSDLGGWCRTENRAIFEIVFENELRWRTPEKTKTDLLSIWEVMKSSVFSGSQTFGILPGGLGVERRAAAISQKFLGEKTFENADEWLAAVKNHPRSFQHILNWVSCFALAVNEQNAAFGRVVTAPTNGAAGVIPAVMMYFMCFEPSFSGEDDLVKFMLTAGELGSIFKKGATISAAMGGCQAEIGVSSAMAAGALCERLGGTAAQAMQAAEIAMEHHLGLTCDPIGGLVQIPCIERNTMGAIKAITAAQIALGSNPEKSKVSLDAVIKTMKDTAADMNHKYKETADGGLAINVPVSLSEC